MKKMKYSVLIKSALLIALSLCTLLAGTMHVFATTTDEKDIATGSLSPVGAAAVSGATVTIFDKVVDRAINDGTTPPTASDYADKYDAYTHVSIENGKSIATVYSAEQIAALNANEWNILAADEALYLLDDTMKLFANYDVVRITNKNGEVETYMGASFYSSDEYYDSFGLITEESADVTYNLKQDVYNAMLTRLEVLASAAGRFNISGVGNEGYVFLGREKTNPIFLSGEAHSIDHYYTNADGFVLPEDAGLDHWCESCGTADTVRCEFCTEDGPSDFCHHSVSNYNSWLYCRDKQIGKDYGILWFEQGNIYYVEDLSNADHRDEIKLYPDQLFDDTVGNVKYDAVGDMVAIIEVWDTATESVIARIRLDSANNPEEIAQLDALWLGVQAENGGIDIADYWTLTDYRVAVYLNDFSGRWGNDAFIYNADGNLDHWAFYHAGDILQPLFLSGTSEIAAYVNAILADTLAE